MVGPIQLSPSMRSPARQPPGRAFASPTRKPPAALSAAEAELANRLAIILDRAPLRTGEPIRPAPIEDLEFAVRLADVLRDDTSVPEPMILPDPPRDTAPVRSIKPAAPWLKQARRARWRSVYHNILPWLMTFAVIAITIGGMFIAVAGVSRSLELAWQAKARVEAEIAQRLP